MQLCLFLRWILDIFIGLEFANVFFDVLYNDYRSELQIWGMQDDYDCEEK